MTKDELLAAAITRLLNQRLDRGLRFLRVPEAADPMPVEDLIANVGDRVRFALLLANVPPEVE